MYIKRIERMSNLKETLQKLKKNDIQDVYLLTGPEYFIVEQFKTNLIQVVKGDDTEDITTYDLMETPIQDVIADAETIPFFSEKKIIFVYHPSFLLAKSDKTPITHDVTSLEQYVEQPAPYTIFVLIAPYEKVDKRKSITKKLLKQSAVVDCHPLQEKALRSWMMEIANHLQIHLTDETFQLLESEFADDLYMLEREMEKLALYVGAGNTVTKEIADEVISPSKAYNALQLVDAVLKRNLHEAVKIYKDLEKMNEEPIGLIALLAYQFRVIFQVKLLKEKGYNLQKIQSEVNVHPYVVKLAVQRSNAFHEERLTHIIHQLTNTDAAIKKGTMEKGIAFELLLYELVASH